VRHQLTVRFDEPISTEAARAVQMLLKEGTRHWGGFRGRGISDIEVTLLEFPEGAHGDVVTIQIEGPPPEADDELLDAFRRLLLRPRPFGVGQARVDSVHAGGP